jgi:hypothetical protein
MNLVERAKGIVMKPREEWVKIDAEPHTVQGLYTRYVMILAAIPAVAAFIGLSFVGFSGFGATYRVPVASGLAQMVLQYLLSLGSVYVIALIIDALAPSFSGEKNFMQAFKVAAFFPTAAWLGGIFHLIPALGILGLVASLYSLYLLYLGLPRLMRSPEDKAVPYTVVVIIVAIVVMVVVSVISSLVVPGPVRGF